MELLTAYGHSWVQGDGASSASRRLVNLVAQQLGCLPNNLGVGGTASAQTAGLIRRAAPPPSWLYVVMTGLNDARLHGVSTTALDSYADSLQAIFSATTSADQVALTVAVLQPQLADYSRYPPHNRGSDAAVDAYNERLRLVASHHPRVLVVGAAGWDAQRMLSVDTVHPNDAGHAALARAVARRVQQEKD
jgi:lysophospholipase L1-like esterase